MKNEIYYCKSLNPAEKMALSYVLKGCKRQKYISADVLAKLLCSSRQTSAKVMASLETKGLIKRMKPEGAKYYIIIVLNYTFDKFAPGLEICENEITKDKDISNFCKLQEETKQLSDIEEGRKAIALFNKIYG